MRTTVTLDDDVYEAARALARSEGESVGRVLSRLARRGLAPVGPGARRGRGGFPIVRLPPDSPAVTPDTVRRLLDDDV